MSWDVIIIGSGAAGSVIARRLVETTDARVLLIEAGGPDVHEAIHDPARSHELWHVEEDWDYFTVPQRGAAGRRLHLPRGRVLGGCTSTNGMIYIRGWHGDYDYWAYLGNAGWSYAEVLPLFKRGEDFDGGASVYRGTGGPLPVQSRYEPHPLSASFVEAALQYGIPHNPDHNGPRLDGVGLAQFTVSDGRRSSAAVAFLAPVLDSEGLEVRSGVTAQRLRFDGERCVGVEVEHHGEREVLFADAEVVVCAGAIESPKLLLLSGIGDPRRLHDVGVPLRVALPGVGANLHDHAVTPLIYACDRALPPAGAGSTAHQAHLFWWSRDGYPAPDLQPLLFNVPLYPDGVTGPANAFTLFPGHVRPASRGTVRLTSADPDAPPTIDPGYLTCPADVEALLAAVRLCRQIAAQSAMVQWGAREIFPGPDVAADEDLRRYIRHNVTTYHHPVGTCKMGVDELAVVDPELRVYGTSGLRVADASIMPAVTTGNTMAPTNMIGERAGDLISRSVRRTEPEPAIR